MARKEALEAAGAEVLVVADSDDRGSQHVDLDKAFGE
jgi:hypothetical protein